MHFYLILLWLIAELVKCFPYWDQLQHIFADHTASCPAYTGDNEQEDDVASILLENYRQDEDDDNYEEGDDIAEEVVTKNSSARPHIIKQGQKRGFKESFEEIIERKEASQLKRSDDMLSFLNNKLSKDYAVKIEKEKVQAEKVKLQAEKIKTEATKVKSELVANLSLAGFSKDEIIEMLEKLWCEWQELRCKLKELWCKLQELWCTVTRKKICTVTIGAAIS